MIVDCGAVASAYYTTSNGTCHTNNSYFYKEEDRDTNHAILIVGWDDNYSAGNFSGVNGNKPTNNGAWIVKNSWGTSKSFLDEGYFYLSYYEGSINTSKVSAVGLVAEPCGVYGLRKQRHDDCDGSVNKGRYIQMQGKHVFCRGARVYGRLARQTENDGNCR